MPPQGRHMRKRGIARQRRHDFRGADKSAEWHATAQGLRQYEDIRGDLPMFAGEQPAGATKAGDDLIENQQRTHLVATLAQPRQKFLVRDSYAALALDRLDNDRGHGLIDLPESTEVIKR